MQKEASRIACDWNEEEECLHLRRSRRREAKIGRRKAVAMLMKRGSAGLFAHRIPPPERAHAGKIGKRYWP
jgi:hypothetical protein